MPVIWPAWQVLLIASEHWQQVAHCRGCPDWQRPRTTHASLLNTKMAGPCPPHQQLPTAQIAIPNPIPTPKPYLKALFNVGARKSCPFWAGPYAP